MKSDYAQLLLICLMYDAFLIHMPFSEVERQIEREIAHFIVDFALAGALLMGVGFRNLV